MHSRRRLILLAASIAAVFGFCITSPLFAANVEKVLYSFHGSDGAFPYPAVIFDGKGNLYGTTYVGGSYGSGTVFELMPGTKGKWTEKVLHSFNSNGQDGANPLAGLIFDAKGNLYGTTYGGGTNYAGTVFELTPGTKGAWTETVLHSFNPSNQDGIYPEAALILDAKGNLYGTTVEGGTYDDGTVFELTPGTKGKWTEKVLHSFNANGHDAAFPEAGLTFDGKGNLYGTTYGGGTNNQGAVFELTQGANGKWTAHVLHSFSFNGKDGFVPEAVLTFDAKGNLCSTTVEGGTYDNGTVFELQPGTNGKWTEKVLYSFDHSAGGGSILYAGVVFDANGNMYGTTYVGGTYSFGTVFELTPGKNGKWTEKVLHSFDPNGTDGLLPEAGLIWDAKGNLYGAATEGGSSGNGVVFEITP